MTLDITQVQFSTTIDTFKNYTSSTGSITVPSQSYTAGQYREFSTTVDLLETGATTQVLQNYSTDSSKYYIGTFNQVGIDSNFAAQTRMTVGGSTLSVTLYVINQTGGTVSVPSFTLNLEVRRFLTPFV